MHGSSLTATATATAAALAQGNFYTKIMSTAQAVEWTMLDSLRQENTWS